MNKLIDPTIYDNFNPLPEDLQGWNGTGEIFENWIQVLQPKTIIEVGTWKGQSAITMGNVVKKMGLETKIFCVDTWLGATEFYTTLAHTPERDLRKLHGYPQVYYQFLSNVVHHGLQEVIVPVPQTSANAARIFAHHGIVADLIYIDGSHEYDDVLQDLVMYWSLLSKGGVMFGDDYLSFEGVRNAVKQFVTFNLAAVQEHLHVNGNNWILTK